MSMTAIQTAARDAVRTNVEKGFYLAVPRHCFLCGHDTFTTVSEKDRYGLPVDVGVCRGCGLPQITRPLRQRDYDDFYVNHYRDLCAGGSADIEGSFATTRGEAFLAMAQRNIPQLSGQTILEIGCGSGGVLFPFAAAGHPVRGYDVDVEGLHFGRFKGLDLREGLLESINEGQQYDIVITSLVLQYFLDVRQNIRRIATLLRAGGHVLVEVGGLKDLRERYNRFDMDFLRCIHINCLFYPDRESLITLFESEGFSCKFADEHVRAVFQKSDAIRGVRPRAEKHDEVLEFLTALEATRQKRAMAIRLRRAMREIREKIGGHARQLGLRG
jgi:SAM-dependent methyltransferase